MAGRQGHVVDIGRVPGRDDVAAAVRVGFQALNHRRNLINHPAVRRGPRAPLLAIDWAKLAVGVGPFIPDADTALLQPAHIGVAAQKPKEFKDDRFLVQLLGGQQGEALGQIKAHLAAKDAQRAGAGTVTPLNPIGQDIGQ